ncbi:MAG: long-chain fatty acid--CoA ligase [Bacteroidetes bacterium]|nr:long-chain fatty acid--CoA ligase [Bacteroidota bacterium]
MPIKRIFDILPRYKKLWPEKKDMLAGKDNGVWVKFSIDDTIEKVNNISYGLLSLGVKKGDKIASITFNRPEWNFIDMGIQQLGAIHIPIYPTISDKDYNYILKHAEVNYIFVAGEEMYRRIAHVIPEIPSLKTVYTFKNLHGFEHLNELIELGANNQAPDELKLIKDSITEDDIATIIYTSGTTDFPKGVVLLHRNIISNFITVSHIPPVYPDSRALSFLPLCHIYERMLNYMYLYLGISVYYCDNIANVSDYLKEAKPTIMGTVPRLLEKIYDKIIAQGRKLKGLKKIIFFWALHIGRIYELNGANGWYYQLRLKVARKLVFSKWKEVFGGNLDIIVSGGAAISPNLCKIFWAVGFRVMEGYGLTETSPVIAVNTFDPGCIKFGTVGPVLPGINVKIADDGEILVKSPGLMKEYFKEPEMTKEAVDNEGWFHTGDMGQFDEHGLLKITGRKKEIFKTSFGKYIAPQMIENKFKESPFIENIIALGENQKFAAAIIVPDFNHLHIWCNRKGIEYTNNTEIIALPRIKKRFLKEVKKLNEHFGDSEKIMKFEMVDTDWTIESGELTATLKLRRTFINVKYAELINKLFV